MNISVKQEKKLVYIGFSFKHHKHTNAGYHNLKNFLNYDFIINCQREHEFSTFIHGNSFLRRITYPIFLILGGRCPFSNIRCIIRMILFDNQVFHYIYPENSFQWLHLFKKKRNEIVFTLHQPKEFYKNSKYWVNVLNKVDKIIVLSKSDQEFYENIFEHIKVIFIPHGINTNYYTNYYKVKRNRSVLMVGNWLRDYELAAIVFKKLIDADKNIEIFIVGANKKVNKFANSPRLHIMSVISNDKLLELYRTSGCLFLPLTQFTANNAVLEAGLTGCPIIVATNCKNSTYFDESYIKYVNTECSEIVSSILELLDRTRDCKEEALLRKKVVDEFSWASVASKTKDYLLG